MREPVVLHYNTFQLKSLFMLVVLLLSACGSGGLNGIYVARGPAHFEKLSFSFGGRVILTLMGGTVVASYAMDGSRVELSANGQTQVLNVDAQGCLQGGPLMGTYCKA